MNPIIPGRAIQPNPEASELIVTAMCEAAGLPRREAFNPAEVATLLGAVGYDCTPRTLAEFIRKGYVSEPPGGQWIAPYVHALAAGLDCRRRWLPSPNPLHDGKKSAARLQVEAAQAEGVRIFPDLEGYSMEDLLLQLTACDNRNLREVLYEAVRAKCEQLGFHEE